MTAETALVVVIASFGLLVITGIIFMVRFWDGREVAVQRKEQAVETAKQNVPSVDIELAKKMMDHCSLILSESREWERDRRVWLEQREQRIDEREQELNAAVTNRWIDALAAQTDASKNIMEAAGKCVRPDVIRSQWEAVSDQAKSNTVDRAAKKVFGDVQESLSNFENGRSFGNSPTIPIHGDW